MALLFRSLTQRYAALIALTASVAFVPRNARCDAPKPIVYDAAAPLDASITLLYDPRHVTAPYGTSRVRFKGANGEVVPGLLTVPLATGAQTKPRKFPCILMLHGLGGSKADMLLLSAAFARRGYASLAIDIAGHGERPRIAGKTVDHLTLDEMNALAATTAVDLRRSVDFLDTYPTIDTDRIGFLGVSLGGILGGLFVGEEPRIKAAALWAAGGDWGSLLVTSQHPFAATFRKTNAIHGPEDVARVERALADVDPLGDIAQVSPRPLLFLNGMDDLIVPRKCADALFQAAREPKQRILLPGGHIPDASTMTLQSLTFFDGHLKDSAKDAR